jgi:SAM-dependent methyltransferase
MSAPATRCSGPTSGGPRPLEFDRLFAAEQRHFWFRSRNRVLARVIGQLTAGLADGYRVLEVGCGNGNVLAELERVCARGEVVGSELFDEGLAHARRRVRCRLIRADVYTMSFPEPFDVVGMFDVLEHLSDDVRALRCLRAALTPNGRLVLTVPAHMALWSDVDVFSEHYRRYSPSGLEAVLRESGYEVEYVTQFMAGLYPLMWWRRRIAPLLRRRGARGEETLKRGRDLALGDLRIVPGLNGLLNLLLGCEVPFLARRWRLPLGTSLLAVAAPAPHTTVVGATLLQAART